MTTDPPSRRKWHFARWLIVLIVATMAWGGWQAYAFRSALKQAEALGWTVECTNPVETIRKNWKAAFRKETWLDGVTYVGIPTGEAFEQHLSIVLRLNPKGLKFDDAAAFHDLSALKPLTRLQLVRLIHCTGLTNVDALEHLPALQNVSFNNCTALTNMDGLKNCSALQSVTLSGCSGLTNLDALMNLPALQGVTLFRCAGLTNVDGLKNLPSLGLIALGDCARITNVDSLKNLSALREAFLDGCTGLTKESVAALKAALPKTRVYAN